MKKYYDFLMNASNMVYLFEDDFSGYKFLVSANNEQDAIDKAMNYTDDAILCGVVDNWDDIADYDLTVALD